MRISCIEPASGGAIKIICCNRSLYLRRNDCERQIVMLQTCSMVSQHGAKTRRSSDILSSPSCTILKIVIQSHQRTYLKRKVSLANEPLKQLFLFITAQQKGFNKRELVRLRMSLWKRIWHWRIPEETSPLFLFGNLTLRPLSTEDFRHRRPHLHRSHPPVRGRTNTFLGFDSDRHAACQK